MKLRNKETGEHGDYQVISAGYLIRVRDLTSNESWQYDCLAGFNDKWEDYKPVEPLIKDEKIRKAVRAWAEANNVTKVWHEGSSVGFCDGAVSIKFHELCWEEIPKGEYTITELCGGEEK